MPSRLEGTPWHIIYLKRNDKRRHKARCKYYSKENICKMGTKCVGSSQCYIYVEKEKKEGIPANDTDKKQNKTAKKGGKKKFKRALNKENSKIKIENMNKRKNRNKSESQIDLGSVVILKDISSHEELLITIVNESDKDIIDGKITEESPIGKLIIGREKGDIIKVYEDTDYEVIYKIIEVDR